MPAWHRNTRKQRVKAPKPILFDSGLDPRLFHGRETRAAEVDLVVERPLSPLLVEVEPGVRLGFDLRGWSTLDDAAWLE